MKLDAAEAKVDNVIIKWYACIDAAIWSGDLYRQLALHLELTLRALSP